MNDPYSVLGLAPSATLEEIRQAYCDLARKYDPKNYANGELADMARQKMDEVNAAYDEIMRSKESEPSDDFRPSGDLEPSQFPEIRRTIAEGKLDEAEWMLGGVVNRTAEWYFLRGGIFYKRGWMDEAKRNLRQALAMEPNNHEYQDALGKLQNEKKSYRSSGRQYNEDRKAVGCGPCDCCAGLLCADCCCHCGDCC